MQQSTKPLNMPDFYPTDTENTIKALKVEPGEKTGGRNDRSAMLIHAFKELNKHEKKAPSKRFTHATQGNVLLKTCYLIHHDRDYVSKKPLDRVAHPYVSWCIPDFSSSDSRKTCGIQLCFDVYEVKEFIDKNTSDNGTCPMFGRKFIQQLVNKNHIEIEENMPNDFREVFTNYELLTFVNAPLKEDYVTKAVLNAVGKHLEKSFHDEKDTNVSFWKATKNLFTSVAYKGWNIAVRALKFVLTSPWWLNVVLSIVRIIRILICVLTSAIGTKDKIIAILRAINAKVRDEIPQAKLPTLLLEMAIDLMDCMFWGNIVSCFTGAKYGFQSLLALISVIGQIFRASGDAIFKSVGLNWLSTSSMTLLTRSPELFRSLLTFDQRATEFAAIQAFMQDFSMHNFELLSVIAFLDTMMLVFGASEQFIMFVLENFSENKELKEDVKTRLKVLRESKAVSFLRLFVEFARNTQRATAMFGWIEEIFYWITDVVPCLFKYFVRLFKIVLTLGFVDFPRDDAACCMKSMIMSLRATLAFNEGARLEKISAQEARAMALDQERQQRSDSEVATLKQQEANIEAKQAEAIAEEKNQTYFSRMGSWLLGRGPANELRALEANYEKLPKTSDKTTNDFKELVNKWTIDFEAEQFANQVLSGSADTFEIVSAPPRKKFSLWIGQCSDETSRRVFENPIFVYDNKIPFYFHEIVGPSSKEPQQHSPWCVAPSFEALKKHYPQATWNIDGDPFVLLQHVPNELTKHMFQLETPIYKL